MRGYRADTGFDGDRRLPDGALVLVDGDRIAEVRPGHAPAPDGCPVSYLTGTAVLPGLIDGHVHLCADDGLDALDKIPGLSDAELDAVITASLAKQLAAGVTTVRDLGDHHWAVLERRRAGRIGAPAVLGSGPPITSPGGHCWSMGGETAGADQLRRAVAERADRGADVVKIMASGGMLTAGTDVLAPQFSLPDLRLVVAEAHRRGLPVTAHAHAVSAIELAVQAGVDGIEHGTGLTGHGVSLPPELVAALAASRIAVDPTLGRTSAGNLPPRVKELEDRLGLTWEMSLERVRIMVAAGVRLISGTDAGIGPTKGHGTLAYAIVDLVTCGMTAEQALQTATGGSADALLISDQTGRLRPGLRADLLLVDGDPSSDPMALHRVRTVVAAGRESSPAPLPSRPVL